MQEKHGRNHRNAFIDTRENNGCPKGVEITTIGKEKAIITQKTTKGAIG
jgi:hypothetical protein